MLVGPSLRNVGDARPADVVILDAAGNPVFGFNPSRPANAALTQVPASDTSVTILAANAARRGGYIFNGGGKTLYLAFGATATVAAYTVPVAKGSGFRLDPDGYTGIITGIWETATTGDAVVTEVS